MSRFLEEKKGLRKPYDSARGTNQGTVGVIGEKGSEINKAGCKKKVIGDHQRSGAKNRRRGKTKPWKLPKSQNSKTLQEVGGTISKKKTKRGKEEIRGNNSLRLVVLGGVKEGGEPQRPGKRATSGPEEGGEAKTGAKKSKHRNQRRCQIGNLLSHQRGKQQGRELQEK